MRVAPPFTARFLALGLCCLTMLAVSPASAFVPRGPWLLDQAMARQLKRKINTLVVEQEVTLYGLSDAPKGLLVPGTFLIAAPDGLRIERALLEGKRIKVVGRKKTRLVEPGQSEQIRKTRPDVLVAFLTVGAELSRANASARLEKALATAKVDTDVVSFVRLDGRVAYIIGCKPWELGQKPALVLDKDTLHLMRVITVTKTADGQRVDDLRLLGWGSAEGGSWFPKTIEKWVDGKLQERAITRAVTRNQQIDKALFDVRR